MSKKNIAILLMFFVTIIACISNDKSVQAKILGNGTDYVQNGNRIYYIADYSSSNKYKYKLCSITTDNKSRKVLDSWENGSPGNLYIKGNKIYYQRGESIYYRTVNGKKTGKITDGIIFTMYSDKIFFTDSRMEKLYVIKTNKKEKKLVYSCKDPCGLSFAGFGGKYMIFNETNYSDENDILCLNMKTLKCNLLTTEGKTEEYQSGPNMAMSAYIYDNNVYYSCGSIEGSMRIFNGNLMRIGIDGNNKKEIVKGLTSENIIISSNKDCIYYGIGEESKMCRLNLKSGKSEVIGNEYAYDIAGDYAYYSDSKNGKVDIYSYKVTEDKTKAVKIGSINKNKKYEYYISKVSDVGNYVYVDISVRRYGDDTGWRGEYIRTETYKINSGGKNIVRLNK